MRNCHLDVFPENGVCQMIVPSSQERSYEDAGRSIELAR